MWRNWFINLANSPRWVEGEQPSFAAQALFLFLGACVGTLVFALTISVGKVDLSVLILPLVGYVFLVVPALLYLWGLGLASFVTRSLILRHLSGLLLIELVFMIFWVGMWLFGYIRQFSVEFYQVRTNPLFYALINVPMLVLAVCMAAFEWLIHKYKDMPLLSQAPSPDLPAMGDTDLLDDFIIKENREDEQQSEP